MSNPFRKVRAVSDKALDAALDNHRANIEGVIKVVNFLYTEHGKFIYARYVTSWWLVVLTGWLLLVTISVLYHYWHS
jgi:hypothetical protein